FAVLCIPVLVIILVVTHDRNLAAIMRILDERIASTRSGSIETAENLIRPVAATLRIVAEAVTADPAFFKTEASRNLLHSALISAEQLDGLYVSFEDGYHRVVTRIDADRRRAWTGVPAEANWHSSHVDEFSSGPSRRRYRTFFDTWPHEIGGF